MNKSKLVLVMVVIFLGGCSMQPTVQKVNESKSGFDGAFYQGETEVVSKDFPNSEQYRNSKKPPRVLLRLIQSKTMPSKGRRIFAAKITRQ